jgi:hypothetical protein
VQAVFGIDTTTTTPASGSQPSRSRVVTAMAHVVYIGTAVLSDSFTTELTRQQQQATAAATTIDNDSNAAQTLAVELLRLFDPYLCTVGSSNTATEGAALLQHEDLTTGMLLWHTKPKIIRKQGPVLYTLIRLSLLLLKRHCGAASSSTDSSKLVLENVHRLKVLVICLLQPLAQVSRALLVQAPLSSQCVQLFQHNRIVVCSICFVKNHHSNHTVTSMLLMLPVLYIRFGDSRKLRAVQHQYSLQMPAQ